MPSPVLSVVLYKRGRGCCLCCVFWIEINGCFLEILDCLDEVLRANRSVDPGTMDGILQ